MNIPKVEQSNYRQRIYANYAKNMQDAGDLFDEIAAKRSASARSWHLRGWLPADRSARIVDLACGNGHLLYFFKQCGYTDIQGVDISADQVALARQVTPNVSHADVIDFLEVHPDCFDLITGYDIIEHFHKDEVMRFLDAAFNALRPGGRLILQTPNADGPWSGQHRYNDFTHEVGFNSNSIERLLKIAGLIRPESRECDPPALGYSFLATVRAFLWQCIRSGLLIYNLIETGSKGSYVFTRVFLASAVKPR